MKEINTHIHTPWSFSSFDSIEQAVSLAKNEQVEVLGISDFNTVEGYEEFAEHCKKKNVYPLFNIEFIALLQEDKAAGNRWNDPANPGVMYFCGKALDFPLSFSAASQEQLKSLWAGTQEHIKKVIEKLQGILQDAGVEVALTYEGIRTEYAKNTVRERHVARALGDALKAAYDSESALRDVLQKVVGDSSFTPDLENDVALQNQLRGHLLKAGKPAFVSEDSAAFLSLEQVMALILDGGGIPCYPVLVDDSRALNENESQVETLAANLKSRNIHAVEFIPTRNSLEILTTYVDYFREHEFCVTFGTEHNTPDLQTLVPKARGAVPFSDALRKVSREGAAILAAHQAKHAAGEAGYVDTDGKLLLTRETREEFIAFGKNCLGMS